MIFARQVRKAAASGRFCTDVPWAKAVTSSSQRDKQPRWCPDTLRKPYPYSPSANRCRHNRNQRQTCAWRFIIAGNGAASLAACATVETKPTAAAAIVNKIPAARRNAITHTMLIGRQCVLMRGLDEGAIAQFGHCLL